MATIRLRHEAALVGPTDLRPMLALVPLLGVGVILAVLATGDAAGLASGWELAHWTIFSIAGAVIAAHGVRTADGPERRIRLGIALATACWLAGQVAWDIQVAVGFSTVPAPSDLLFLATILPAAWALDQAMSRARSVRMRMALYLDAGIALLATATITTTVFGHQIATGELVSTAILLVLPVTFIALASAGMVVALATGAELRPTGIFAVVIGTGLLGAGYLPWVADAPQVPAPGSWTNLLFSAGIVAMSVGGATFRLPARRPGHLDDARSRILDALPAAAVGLVLLCLMAGAGDTEAPALVRPLGWAVIMTAALRQVLLARDRAVAARQAHLASSELALVEERHRRVIERIPATVYIDERAGAEDRPSRLAFISPQVSRLLGYTERELAASANWWYELIHPEDSERVAAAEDRHFLTGEALDQTFRMRTSDGSFVWVRDEANLIVHPDGRLQSHGVLTDVTAEKRAEDHVRRSEAQQRRIIETSSSAYVAIDRHGLVTDWNERAVQTFGWRRDEALGQRLGALIVPPDQREAHEAGLRRYVASGTGPLVGQRVEVQAVDRTGRTFPVELTIWPVRVGDELTFSALIHDITERRRLEDELRYQAFHDSLTGLANRALFGDRLAHALQRRDGARTAVLAFDLDDFKVINDGLGHAAGDALLVQVGERLGSVLRAGDTAARLGGDEFAVLVEDMDEASACLLADRIVELFAQPFAIAGRRVSAAASLGVAVGWPGVGAEALLRDADLAMYEAKRRGKGVWQVFDPSLARLGLDAIELRADLKLAIESAAITVVYQPIVEIGSRAVVGVEALARWSHPTRGPIPPAQFIPIAEASEMITALGIGVLRQACRDVRRWRAAAAGPSDLHLSVNLSARQLVHATIVQDVADVLAETGLEPEALTLEITEGVVVDDTGRSLAAIEGLKALGVRIAVDDFGTGYSSLSYLSRLPIDVLKIDRSFVTEASTSRQAAALVRSIVRIGQALHLDIVAEGIETEAQLERLGKMGAGYGQGYLFSRPLDPRALTRYLRSRHDARRVPVGPPQAAARG